MTEWRGTRGAAPLGARLRSGGADVAVASLVADRVELCILDAAGVETRCDLAQGEAGVWRGRVEDVAHGQRYGLRVHASEHARSRCDPTKLLVDPRALAVTGAVELDHSALATPGVDTAGAAPMGVFVDSFFDWADDDAVRPRVAWEDTIIYECHVRGMTMRHRGIPDALRGTYAGLGHEATVAHLTSLGVTAVELLPICEILDERFLTDTGRTNYWGYNSLAYCAPAARYSAAVRAGEVGGQVAEFKEMVRALHAAGIEVLLDVVFNHTAEGDDHGPVVSLRGLDAEAYYRHDDIGNLVDTTGCGNSLNAASPLALGLVMDALRYWVNECHVDGFRFDLAPTLARPEGRFDPLAPFFELCVQDPSLRGAKLIAEPWDVGADDSYVLGRFPPPFREWNGRFRDAVRDFWRSEDAMLGELATRMAGSADLFDVPGRTPTSSVNFVTAHDGFTLEDLVTYEVKHNEENGQGNADGTDDNRSWNCGVEGPSDDPEIIALRGRQARVLMGTVLLSAGVPMLVSGDEFGRTQRGNNNAYCQDNELSWLDWDHLDLERLAFTQRLVALRRRCRVLSRRRFVLGAADELGWFTPEGATMTPEDWADPVARCVAIHLGAHGAHGTDAGEDDLVVFVNGWWEPMAFRVPAVGHERYAVVADTYEPSRPESRVDPGESVEVGARSIVVLAPEAS